MNTDKQPKKQPSGRIFTASVKPAWTPEQMQEFSNSLVGSALVYLITHDKDTDEHEILKEPHTHILIIYKTPRLLSTVANLLNVDTNFIELVKNKSAMLRYLTHKDDKQKYQYLDSQVITNNPVAYGDVIKGVMITDKEIADKIIAGFGMDLIGIVEPNRLAAIQRFIHFDATNSILTEMRTLRQEVNALITNITGIVNPLLNALDTTADSLKKGMQQIAGAIVSAGKRIKSK